MRGIISFLAVVSIVVMCFLPGQTTYAASLSLEDMATLHGGCGGWCAVVTGKCNAANYPNCVPGGTTCEGTCIGGLGPGAETRACSQQETTYSCDDTTSGSCGYVYSQAHCSQAPEGINYVCHGDGDPGDECPRHWATGGKCN